MDPLRVLVVSHLYPSAARQTDGPWLAEQVDALVRAGVQVDVLCPSPFESDHEMVSAARGVRITYRSTSAGRFNGSRIGFAVSALRYRRVVRRHLAETRARYDVLHAHFGFPDAYATVGAAQSAGLPTVVTLHGSDAKAALAPGCPFGALIRARLYKAARVICVSDELAEKVRRRMPSVSVVTVNNGYDDVRFSVSQKERDLGFVFLGALRKVKGIDLLLDAYLTHPELHSLPLTIAGDGPMRAELERHAADSAAPVRFLGRVSRDGAADALRRAKSVVMPSRSEGWGSVAAEALACGTPVIGTRVGGLPVIVASRSAGILLESPDSEALANAMREALEREWVPEEVAAANGARPWSALAEEIVSVYRDVAEGAGS